MYRIKDYSYEKANDLNMKIYPSTRKHKKIDVYSPDDQYLFSIGDSRYTDYPTLLETDKELAEKKRKLYHARHQKDIHHLKGFTSLYVLW
jgi:hypothetical protein